MGACHSSSAVAVEHSQIGTEMLPMERRSRFQQQQQTHKLLFLGTSESGKSTCRKQMQIILADGFSDDEVEQKKHEIWKNIVVSMVELCKGVETFGMQYEDLSHALEANCLRSLVNNNQNGEIYEKISSSVKEAIKGLWEDPAVRFVYDQRSLLHVQDSAKFFFENIDRIASIDYRPSNRDILLARVPTIGVSKLTFTLNNEHFTIFDVGGQRSERIKWIHFFDDIDGVIFVAAVSEYDQLMREDGETNRLMESLDLFEEVSKNKNLKKASIILFLNKKDLFQEKIQKVPLSEHFTAFKGPNDFENGMRFVKQEFMKRYRQDKMLYLHQTCATDTGQLTQVYEAVLDTVIQANLQNNGML